MTSTTQRHNMLRFKFTA